MATVWQGGGGYGGDSVPKFYVNFLLEEADDDAKFASGDSAVLSVDGCSCDPLVRVPEIGHVNVSSVDRFVVALAFRKPLRVSRFNQVLTR
jgi:hypothetical protein